MQAYKCEKCGRVYSAVLPTSVTPAAAVIFTAAFFWSQILPQFIPYTLIAYPAAFLCSGGFFLCGAYVAYRSANPWLQHKVCEDCRAALHSEGGAFVDGVEPGLQELLIYVFVILVPLVLSLTLDQGKLTFLQLD